jgi:cell division protein FtsB
MNDPNMNFVEAPSEKSANEAAPSSLGERGIEFAQRAWRPAGTIVAIALAGLLMFHVVTGRNGLTVWRQKRTEDRQLHKEIDQLQLENASLREHVERLKSDPDAIEREAREKLHYAKPNEIIVALPESETSLLPAESEGK